MILDIGCGSTDTNPKRGDVGIDLLKGNCDVVADAHILPFRDDVFDRVFLIAVLEHLKQPSLCLEEVKRVCKRGAVAYMRFPQQSNMTKWLLRKMFTDFPVGIYSALKWLVANKTDPHRDKDLGHKTQIHPSFIAGYFAVVDCRREGQHGWFVGRKSFLIRRLGLKDRTRLDTWDLICKNDS